MPSRDLVRQELDSLFKISELNSQGVFRVFKVEDLGDYRVFIQVPGYKSEYDFFVWRAIYNNEELASLKVPSHDDLGSMYLDLKRRDAVIDEHLMKATLKFIRERWSLNKVIDHYFRALPGELLNDVKKFLLTLKWIALQEDANYPPPNLGSIYALSVYTTLEAVGDPKALRRIIRFGR